MYAKLKFYGPKLVLGDCNSRIHRCQASQDHVFGEYCFGIDDFDDSPLVNCSLLFGFCEEVELYVALFMF